MEIVAISPSNRIEVVAICGVGRQKNRGRDRYKNASKNFSALSVTVKSQNTSACDHWKSKNNGPVLLKWLPYYMKFSRDFNFANFIVTIFRDTSISRFKRNCKKLWSLNFRDFIKKYRDLV